jgi:EmrB/QacA subfamily drug resistance transporter
VTVSPRVERPTRSRWLALVVLCTGFLLIVVDLTIVNVALPAIQRDLRFTPAGLAWVVNAYLIAFSGLMLLAGRLGDLVGRKRLYIAGLSVFTGASVLCGISNEQAMLIGARFVQGVGAATSSALVLAMIVRLFPSQHERAEAFGVFGFVAAAGGAIGLLAGGAITQVLNWHWIFFVNLPLGLAAIVTAAILVQSDRGVGLRGGADYLGALLITSALMLGVYAIVESDGWIGGVALLLMGAFIGRQAMERHPIMPLRLFASRTLSIASTLQAMLSAAFLGLFFMASLDFQHVLRFSPLAIGLAFLPCAGLSGLVSVLVSAPLTERIGPLFTLLIGQAAIVFGLLLLGIGPSVASYPAHLLIPMILLGIGGGLCFPALATVAMARVHPDDAGLASGLLNTAGQVGGALGIAVMASLAAARYMDQIRAGLSEVDALAAGYHFTWFIAAGTVTASMLLGATLFRLADATSFDSRARIEIRP